MRILILTGLFLLSMQLQAQNAAALVAGVRAKLAKVNDYEASGSMKTNVAFIKAPVAKVKIWFKKPDKLKITNESGISFIPKGSVNINLANLFSGSADFDILDGGLDSATGWHVVKMLPKDVKSDVALSVLYIDEKTVLIRRAVTTSRENGTFDLEMSYGKYAAFGLADKVTFTFNTRDYKLPKGVTLDYDDGTQENNAGKLKNKTGRVEITYTSYQINKGVADSVFN